MEITIDQDAVWASLAVTAAVLAIWWVFSLGWDGMGRQKIPIYLAVLAIGLAAFFVQRYVRILRLRQRPRIDP